MLDLILTAVVYGILVLITLDAYFGKPVQRGK